jgi:hypothetical protein
VIAQKQVSDEHKIQYGAHRQSRLEAFMKRQRYVYQIEKSNYQKISSQSPWG